jgi:hypothetical protein
MATIPWIVVVLARKTNHIERFNNTLRQRASRLVHAALAFSKKLANHIGAIKSKAQKAWNARCKRVGRLGSGHPATTRFVLYASAIVMYPIVG